MQTQEHHEFPRSDHVVDELIFKDQSSATSAISTNQSSPFTVVKEFIKLRHSVTEQNALLHSLVTQSCELMNKISTLTLPDYNEEIMEWNTSILNYIHHSHSLDTYGNALQILIEYIPLPTIHRGANATTYELKSDWIDNNYYFLFIFIFSIVIHSFFVSSRFQQIISNPWNNHLRLRAEWLEVLCVLKMGWCLFRLLSFLRPNRLVD